MTARATWFSIDIECSGPVPGLYDMISLGAVVVRRNSDAIHIGDTWYREFIPTGPRVDPGAMAVNGLDLDALKAHGVPLADGLRSLNAFVAEQRTANTKAVFVGHNAPFDWSFVAHGYVRCGLTNPFGYKALDTKALAAGVLGLHWLDSNKEVLAERLTLPDVERENVHRADYDALYQAHILAELLRRMPSDASR
ncbi:MAG: 3'-5' exonuclease [Myxococcota bacterium]